MTSLPIIQRLMKRIQHFVSLSTPEKLVFLEAALWLIIAKAMVKCLPFKWIAPRLSNTTEELPHTIEFPPETRATIALVSRAVERIAAHSGGKFVCLPQAIAGKMLLKRRKIPNTLYLGIEYSNERNFKAHAWLKAGRHFITGQSEHHTYTKVSAFTHTLD